MRVCLYLLMGVVLVSTCLPAKAQFVLYPLRTVLNTDNRVTDFTVTNTSDQLMQAQVTLVDFVATPDGYALANHNDRQNISAAPWLIVHPAQFSVEPGKQQTIKVTYRGSNQPQLSLNGERRSHLYVQAGPARTQIRKASTGGLGLDMSLGISVPVIIRPDHFGAPSPYQFSKTRLTRDANSKITVKADLAAAESNQADSSISPYGAVCAEHYPAGSLTPSFSRCAENISVFPETPYRRIAINLDVEDIAPGSLKLIYRGRAEHERLIHAIRTFRVDAP